MKSRTSLCNGTLLGKNIRRFAPLWGMFAVLLLLIGPFYLLRSGDQISIRYDQYGESTFVPRYFQEIGDFGMPILFVYALLCAGVCFKYLHKTTSAYMLHAFPLTRDCQFCTNLISGLLFALVPTLAMGLLDLPVILLNNGKEPFVPMLEMLAKWTLLDLFFYGAAVFCMVLSGRTVIAVLSYFALNLIGWFLPTVIQESLIEPMFAGWVGHDFTALSPIVYLSDTGVDLHNYLIYVYAAVGVLLMIAAWLHYRLRHMERAGDAMAYGWAKPVYAVLFSLVFGLTFGNILALIFSSELAGYVFWLLFGVSLGWVFAQMMLCRTVRVWKQKHWIGLAALLGAILCLVLCLRYDVFGRQKLVPTVDQIASVEVRTRGDDWRGGSDTIEITKAEDVELVRVLHEKALAAKAESPQHGGIFSSYRYYGEGTIYLTYHLKNGSTLKRAYCIEDLDVLLPQGRALYEKPEYAVQYYSRMIPLEIESASLEDTTSEWNPETEIYYSRPTVYTRELSGLRDAILEDAGAGRLPIPNQFIEGVYEKEWRYQLMIVSNDMGTVRLQITESATSTLALFEGK